MLTLAIAMIFLLDRPQWKDLHMYVIPRYAAKWRRTGALLGLSTGALDIIENDCRGKAESCCNAMFEKWLDIDHSASWGKLFDAGIELAEIIDYI